LSKMLGIHSHDFIRERYSLLRARIFTSHAVLDYLDDVEKIFGGNGKKKAIDEVRKIQKFYITSNTEKLVDIEKEYPRTVEKYQRNVINHLIHSKSDHT
jgi:hypothetical protein